MTSSTNPGQTGPEQAGYAALREQRFGDAERIFGSLSLEHEREPQYAFGLAMALYGQRALEPALEALARCCRVEPGFVHAWLYAGTINEQLGRLEPAAAAYLRAIRLTDRFDPKLLPAEVNEMLDLGSRVVRQRLAVELDSKLYELSRRHGTEALARIRAGTDYFVGRAKPDFGLSQYRPSLFFVPGLKAERVHDSSAIAGLKELQASFAALRAEALAVSADPEAASGWIAAGEHALFALVRQGEPIEANLRRMPQAAALLPDFAELHRVPRAAPNIQLIRIPPKSKIPPRYGSVNARLMALWLLSDPGANGTTALLWGTDRRPFAAGELRLIDECFEHAIINDSDSEMLLLNFDLWNPQLSAAEREAFAVVMSGSADYEMRLMAAN